jgi:hypothetical protein
MHFLSVSMQSMLTEFEQMIYLASRLVLILMKGLLAHLSDLGSCKPSKGTNDNQCGVGGEYDHSEEC